MHLPAGFRRVFSGLERGHESFEPANLLDRETCDRVAEYYHERNEGARENSPGSSA